MLKEVSPADVVRSGATYARMALADGALGCSRLFRNFYELCDARILKPRRRDLGHGTLSCRPALARPQDRPVLPASPADVDGTWALGLR